jgi:hypothetical protein
MAKHGILTSVFVSSFTSCKETSFLRELKRSSAKGKSSSVGDLRAKENPALYLSNLCTSLTCTFSRNKVFEKDEMKVTHITCINEM